jgi:hypothetical protein
MSTKLNRIPSGGALFALAAWLGVLGMASCSSGDETTTEIGAGPDAHASSPGSTAPAARERAERRDAEERGWER